MEAIWLFAGGDMQEIAAKKIIERGYKLILTDMNPNCRCSKYANEFIELDTFDIKGNLKAAMNLKNKYKIRAVLTAGADCHETVANVGRALNLNSISPEISNICRVKNKTREILLKAGIPQPKFKRVGSLEDAKNAVQKIGLPVALKATNNSGSRGFSVIRDIDDLTPEVFERAVSSGTTGYAIIEELLIPLEQEIAEQSVEILWYNGKMYWLNWVDRLFRKDFMFFDCINTAFYSDIQWGIEIGHINPAVHDYTIKQKVYELIHSAGLAIGMKNEKGGHILKADIILTKNGPFIMELTPRLSGGWDSSASTPRREGDFVGGVISLALGEELDLDSWHKYFEYKNPGLFVAILTQISYGAKDCIGRKFSIGMDFQREKSVQKAFENLLEKRYIDTKNLLEE
jgi:biotin carboxylase